MSKYMLDDSNTINDFNPYVMGDFSLPGASRKPHDFDTHPLPAMEIDFPVDEQSPLCDYGITAGDNTIDMCRRPKSNCSLSRPLIPGRNIDKGFTTILMKQVNEMKKSVEMTGKQCGLNIPIMIIIFLILLVALQ